MTRLTNGWVDNAATDIVAALHTLPSDQQKMAWMAVAIGVNKQMGWEWNEVMFLPRGLPQGWPDAVSVT